MTDQVRAGFDELGDGIGLGVEVDWIALRIGWVPGPMRHDEAIPLGKLALPLEGAPAGCQRPMHEEEPGPALAGELDVDRRHAAMVSRGGSSISLSAG